MSAWSLFSTGKNLMMSKQGENKIQKTMQQQPPKQVVVPVTATNENNVQLNVKYIVGQFSKYAVQKENQISKVKEYINKIVKQAIISHLQKIKELMDFQKKTQQKAKALQAQFRALFNGDVEKMYKFLQNPIEMSLEQVGVGAGIYNIIQKFTQRVLKMHNLAIIDGKLAQIKSVKFQKSIKDQSATYIPVNFHNNAFIKIGQAKIPIYAFLYDGQFKTKEQLMSMTPEQREIIINMVKQFLIAKKIAFKEQLIHSQIQKNIQDAKKK